jgi:hypothetical protein
MTLTIIKKNFEVLTLLETWMFKITTNRDYANPFGESTETNLEDTNQF